MDREIAPVGRQYLAYASARGEQHYGRVGEVHRLIGVFPGKLFDCPEIDWLAIHGEEPGLRGVPQPCEAPQLLRGRKQCQSFGEYRLRG